MSKKTNTVEGIKSFLKQYGDNIDSVLCYLLGFNPSAPSLEHKEFLNNVYEAEYVAFKVVYFWDQILSAKVIGIDEENLKTLIYEHMKKYGFFSEDELIEEHDEKMTSLTFKEVSDQIQTI